MPPPTTTTLGFPPSAAIRRAALSLVLSCLSLGRLAHQLQPSSSPTDSLTDYSTAALSQAEGSHLAQFLFKRRSREGGSDAGSTLPNAAFRYRVETVRRRLDGRDEAGRMSPVTGG